MQTVEQLKTIFEEYATFAYGLPKTSPVKKILKPGDTSSERHPRHGEFFAAVENWTREFAAQEPSSEERMQALEVLLLTAAAHNKKAPYWYMIAVQRHALPLIAGLQEDRRSELAGRYRECYPYNTQLPVQQEVEKLLMGGEAPSLWQRLFGR